MPVLKLGEAVGSPKDEDVVQVAPSPAWAMKARTLKTMTKQRNIAHHLFPEANDIHEAPSGQVAMPWRERNYYLPDHPAPVQFEARSGCLKPDMKFRSRPGWSRPAGPPQKNRPRCPGAAAFFSMLKASGQADRISWRMKAM